MTNYNKQQVHMKEEIALKYLSLKNTHMFLKKTYKAKIRKNMQKVDTKKLEKTKNKHKI